MQNCLKANNELCPIEKEDLLYQSPQQGWASSGLSQNKGLCGMLSLAGS